MHTFYTYLQLSDSDSHDGEPVPGPSHCDEVRKLFYIYLREHQACMTLKNLSTNLWRYFLIYMYICMYILYLQVLTLTNQYLFKNENFTHKEKHVLLHKVIRHLMKQVLTLYRWEILKMFSLCYIHSSVCSRFKSLTTHSIWLPVMKLLIKYVPPLVTVLFHTYYRYHIQIARMRNLQSNHQVRMKWVQLLDTA